MWMKGRCVLCCFTGRTGSDKADFSSVLRTSFLVVRMTKRVLPNAAEGSQTRLVDDLRLKLDDYFSQKVVDSLQSQLLLRFLPTL